VVLSPIRLNGTRPQSSVAADAIETPVPPETPLRNAPEAAAAPTTTPRVKPDTIVAAELGHLKKQISLLMSSGYPGLDSASKYYLQASGKLFRPMVVFLMARATSVAPKLKGWKASCVSLESTFNTPISPLSIIADQNPDLSILSSRSMPANILGTLPGEPIAVLGTQRRLAEIVELIHTASLLHDDVVDLAETRRGMPSTNVFSGNKLSILAGDYMLARASVFLARLRQPEVVELIAGVVSEIVKGELYQLTNTRTDYGSAEYLSRSMDYYLEKTYLKTASLISKSCRASAILGGATSEVAEAAYIYGKHMGLAFQLIDDVLDYTGSNEELGKPATADLELGLATAPVFYAWEEFPELGPMIARKFAQEGDAAKVRPNGPHTFIDVIADRLCRRDGWCTNPRGSRKRGSLHSRSVISPETLSRSSRTLKLEQVLRRS
jgi:hexaprenyl-diphosphate synthase